FGKGFDVSNLRYMRLFYKSFPICDTLCHELSWSHYRTMLRVDNPEARQRYMHEAATQNWSVRALDRQIGTLYYERMLLSNDKASVEAEAEANIAVLPRSLREFVRDPVMLEFLGLPGTGKLLESKLEQALMDKLQAFLLELGKGFAFVARQQRISTESQDFYVDLVFYNYLLKCFVLIDLKNGKLTHQDIGQMDMYVRMYETTIPSYYVARRARDIVQAARQELTIEWWDHHRSSTLFPARVIFVEFLKRGGQKNGVLF
ncbi:MAG: PDDEXK nuclease domain-containing protein, partial [Chlorobium sp.]